MSASPRRSVAASAAPLLAPHPAGYTVGPAAESAAAEARATLAAADPAGAAAGTHSVVPVDLGDRSYPIYIGDGIIDAGAVVARHLPGMSCLVVTNETVGPLYLDRVVSALTKAKPGLRVETVVLRDGEEHKTVEEVGKVWEAAVDARLDRRTTFIALGGGVVGDMTGWAAASYLRGVAFVQMPTTVMAMVDSSVGGKTGVNLSKGKNLVGAFYQPECVVADVSTLRTLPDRELRSGLSEALKYGLIGDAPFFEWMEGPNGSEGPGAIEALVARDEAAMSACIARSCEDKARTVAADEREGAAGERAKLNLGHTFGHAIETHTGERKLAPSLPFRLVPKSFAEIPPTTPTPSPNPPPQAMGAGSTARPSPLEPSWPPVCRPDLAGSSPLSPPAPRLPSPASAAPWPHPRAWVLTTSGPSWP